MTLAEAPRPALTGTQVTLIRASATLRGWSDVLELDQDGDEQKRVLVQDLKRIARELWNLAD